MNVSCNSVCKDFIVMSAFLIHELGYGTEVSGKGYKLKCKHALQSFREKVYCM
jgi:hypothetical protein